MKLNRLRWIVLTFFITGFLLQCSSDEPESIMDEVETTEIVNIELFIEFEQGGLLVPGQIDMLNGSDIAILDFQRSEVLVFSPESESLLSFGGEGRGPGEALAARSLQIIDNDLFIVDPEQLRVNQFTLSGEFIRSFNFDTGRSLREITVTGNGQYISAAMGENGSLVKKRNVDEANESFFGEAMVTDFEYGDMEIERRTLQNREIPDLYKNRITTTFGDNHIYVFLDAYSKIQKYTKDGELILDRELDLPVNEKIFDDAVQRAREPGAPNTVPSWRYITSMKIVEGELYLLWAPFEDTPRQLVRVNSAGEVEKIYHIPEEEPMFADFAIDLSSEKIYLTAPDRGEVYVGEIEL